ncbi:ABC transporter permease, partial [Mesorhizobium sp. M7A.F.Ca.CA.001.08.2.1]
MSFSTRLHSNATGWLLPALVIAGWEIASRAGVMPANVLPAR